MLPTTRWQGMASAIGLAAQAPATTRTEAWGSDRAGQLRVGHRPSNGIVRSFSQTRRWNRRPAHVERRCKSFGWACPRSGSPSPDRRGRWPRRDERRLWENGWRDPPQLVVVVADQNGADARPLRATSTWPKALRPSHRRGIDGNIGLWHSPKAVLEIMRFIGELLDLLLMMEISNSGLLQTPVLAFKSRSLRLLRCRHENADRGGVRRKASHQNFAPVYAMRTITVSARRKISPERQRSWTSPFSSMSQSA